LGTSNLAFAIPLALLAISIVALLMRPEVLTRPAAIDWKLPSERAIPSPAPKRAIPDGDPTHRFRFAATGTELRAGIPYWIFRAMPRLFPDVFQGRGYERFGFDEEDGDYYEPGTFAVPRGMTLADSRIHLPFLDVEFRLKRVAITCAGCHRGAYLNAQGRRVLVDGMPNHTADLQGFKRFFAQAFVDARFQPDRVIQEINRLLAEDAGAAGPGDPKRPERLTPFEELVYRALVVALRRANRERVSAWMDARADNGPGRIDPFNAVKFEVLRVADDGTAATLDFPSVWNQRRSIRPWHHYDGNTRDSSARNFGSVIGVGAVSLSVDKASVMKVGAWLDQLPPPRYPFQPPAPDAVARGLSVFGRACAGCHGFYDPRTNAVDAAQSPQFMKVVPVGTDPERWKAFSPEVARKLGEWGERRGLWPQRAFRGNEAGGYLCGPLDGIWARAPYLHNGSVPTIAELLKPYAERVTVFYRGSRRYDEDEMGWVYTEPTEDDRPLFRYETHAPAVPGAAAEPVPGNGNQGHPYTVADPGDRADLIAYLKTL
jgi:hypothetical protein